MASTAIPLSLRLQRAYYQHLSRYAPQLAVRLLWQIFTPRRKALKPPHLNIVALAAPFTIALDAPFCAPAPIKLAGYRWGTGDKTILLVHGWEGAAVDYYALIPVLLAAGFAVTALDMPAHGHSTGKRANVQEFEKAIQSYLTLHGMPYGIVAHSLAGIAVGRLLASSSQGPAKLVLLATALSVHTVFSVLFDQLKVPVSVRDAFYQRLTRTFQASLQEFCIPDASRLAAKEILLGYDLNDELVNPEPLQAYLNCNPTVKGLQLAAAGHYRILRDAQVLQAITGFLTTTEPAVLPQAQQGPTHS